MRFFVFRSLYPEIEGVPEKHASMFFRDSFYFRLADRLVAYRLVIDQFIFTIPAVEFSDFFSYYF